MALAKPPIEPEAEVPEPEALSPGFHVKVDGASVGCYLTAADAEAFISGQLKPQGIIGEVVEVG